LLLEVWRSLDVYADRWPGTVVVARGRTGLCIKLAVERPMAPRTAKPHEPWHPEPLRCGRRPALQAWTSMRWQTVNAR
jgi:hypothetical protein